MPTLSDIMAYLKPIRAPLRKLNAIFDNTLQELYNQSVWCTAQLYNQDGNFRSIANYLPYNAGYSYISINLNSANGVKNTTMAYVPDTLNNTPPYAFGLFPSSDLRNINDANQRHNIAGYVVYERVDDFCKRIGIYNATPMYGGTPTTKVTNGGTDVAQYAECDVNGNLINQLSAYKDYVIPYVEWYTDSITTEGARVVLNPSVFDVAVNNVINFTAINTAKKISSGGIAGAPPQYVVEQTHLGATGALFAAIPYAKTNEQPFGDRYTYRNRNPLFCGSVITVPDVAPASSVETYSRRIVPSKTPWVSLALEYPASGKPSNIYEVEGGRYVCGGADAVFQQIIAYRSAEEFEGLFADAGVLVSSDLDAVYNYKEQDSEPIVNPDPTDTLESFPDNTTDITPINSGYITPSSFGGQLIYNPLSAKTFFKWVGDSGINIDSWRRLFANPIDVILGAKLYNLDLVAHDSTHVQYNAQTDILGVVNSTLPNHSIDIGYNNIVDGGTLYLPAYYGNYADFTSMTYQCYIPFVGFTTLRAGDVVNTTLHLKYAVDFASGSAVAFLTANDKLIFTAACNVAGNIPITVSDRFSQELTNTIAGIKGLGGVIMGAAAKNPGMALNAIKDTASGLQLQTHYTNRGNLSSINTYELIPPFVERTRFDLFYPDGNKDYQKYVGTPSTQFDTLARCADSNGYVTADYVYLQNCPATDAEQTEIKRIIANGVYL